MQKIKRTSVKSSGGGRRLLRILFTVLLCGLLIAVGYLAAFYLTKYF